MNGLLLINLGTPLSPTTREVRRYLREFLNDARVIDIPWLWRALLLNLFILPLRPRRSAAAYRQVWTEKGSPLLHNSQELRAAVQAKLGTNWRVALGMRYGQPSLRSAFSTLQGVDRLVVLPLYPQHAMSSSGSSLAAVYDLLAAQPLPLPVSIVEPFFADAGFLDAFATRGAPVLEQEKPDHVLFSFHGLPERHMRKADPTGRYCLSRPDCSLVLTAENRGCYRAQCFATAQQLAKRLQLDAERYTVCFQSRLGRTPWIQPHTDQVILQLAQKGCRRVVVFCPAFVADCLETLEEIGLRARADFRKAGGQELTLVPSLNAMPEWVETVARLAQQQLALRK